MRLIGIAALLGLFLAALACGPGPATPPRPPPTPGPAAALTPTPTAPTAEAPRPPVVKPKPTGELRVALTHLGLEVLDPVMLSSSSKHIIDMIFDPLVGATDQGDLTTETGLARKKEE